MNDIGAVIDVDAGNGVENEVGAGTNVGMLPKMSWLLLYYQLAAEVDSGMILTPRMIGFPISACLMR